MFFIDKRKLELLCAEKCVGCVELTKLAGVSSCVLHNIKKGSSVNPKTLGKLAKALNVNPIDLLKEDTNE